MNLPKGWKGVCLGDVLSRIDYGSASKSESSGSFPVLRMGNLNAGKIDWNDLVYSSSKGEYKKYALNYGDILFNRTNSRDLVGKTSIYRGECPAIFAGYLIRLRTQNFCDPFFLNAFMNSASFADFCRIARTDAIGQSNINAQSLQRCELLLPPLPEQKAIAGLLSTWDAAIEKTEQLIKAKEKQFQWLLDELITKPSKSGKWKEVEIGNLLRESRIPDTGNLVEKRLSVRLHLKGIEVRDTRGTEAEGATNYFIRRKGQFIYGKQNVFRGAIGIVPKELDGYSTTQDLPAFDFVGKVDPIWFLWFFSRPNFYEGLEKFATGSGSKRLHSEELFSIKINLPPLKEQVNVAQYLDFANRELNRLKQLAEQYKLQKRGLMQRLLTGQWRLKEFT
jgi:type I restriction enzyme, S subunit